MRRALFIAFLQEESVNQVYRLFIVKGCQRSIGVQNAISAATTVDVPDKATKFVS